MRTVPAPPVVMGAAARGKRDPLPVIPNWPQFLEGCNGCIRYRPSLDEQAPKAPRSDKSYRG